MTTVGVIGLGEIGGGIATGLLGAGFDVVVTDVRPEAAARFADRARVAADAAEVGERCEVTVVAVVDDEQALAVTAGPAGALAGAFAGAVLVVVSTVSLGALRTIAAAAARRDVEVVDCGVSGGPHAAAEGALVSMVGGDESTVARLEPVLGAFSGEVIPMGPLGAGLRAKLARNLVQYASWLAAYEAQRLAEASGVDLRKLARAIRASDRRIGGASTLMFRDTVAPFSDADDENLVRAMRTGATLAHKDLRAALALGRELGLDLPLAEMTEARCDALFGVGPDPVAAP